MLVVPRHHDRCSLPDHPEFVAWLGEARGQGADVLLHGLTHLSAPGGGPPRGLIARAEARFLTAGEGEFQTLDRARAEGALREGLATLEDALGVRPVGFVAPAWLESEHVAGALRDLGFRFHEDHLWVHDLIRGRRLLAPAVTFTGRSRTRAVLSIGWARAMELALATPLDLRLALHPVDFDHDDLVEAIDRLVRAISRRREWIGYGELLA
jgi:predicted deacetylase